MYQCGVGFLTLLESLNFCKVGHLKRPKWPIWVVGSESQYTVLFAFHPSVQDENEMEERESRIRRAFDAQIQSGGGGFIGVEDLHLVLKETNINLPSDKLDRLCKTKVEVAVSEGSDTSSSTTSNEVGGKEGGNSVVSESPQHAPLVDCIGTRWAWAACNWNGDPPSIV